MPPLRKLLNKAIFLSLIALTNHVLAAGPCYNVNSVLGDLRKQGYDPILQAVQVNTTPESREKWERTEEFLDDRTRRGVEIDQYIDMLTDDDVRAKVRERLSKKGFEKAYINKAEQDVEELVGLLMKKKFKLLSRGLEAIEVYRNYKEHNTVLLRQTDDGYCEAFRMSTYRYRDKNASERPEWVSPKSELAREIEKYRKTRGFWLAFYGKADTGETVVVLGNQHFHLDRTLLPYHFNGVILIARDNTGELKYSRELIRFIPNRSTFYE